MFQGNILCQFNVFFCLCVSSNLIIQIYHRSVTATLLMVISNPILVLEILSFMPTDSADKL